MWQTVPSLPSSRAQCPHACWSWLKPCCRPSGAILLFVVVLGVVIAILPILTAISFIAPIVNISLLSNHPIFIAIITTLCLLLVIYKLWRLRGVLVYGILSLIFAIAVFFFNESNTVLATIYNTLTTFWSSL